MGDSVTKVEEATDPTIIAEVGDLLKALDTEPSTPAEPVAEPAPEGEPSETPAGEEPPTPKESEGDEPEEASAEDDTSTPAEPEGEAADAIPDSHYRALQHEGLLDEFAEIYEVNPKAALKMASKCHERVNAASKQLGELGQALRRARTVPPAPAATATPAPAESKRAKLAKTLKEKYEDDPLVDVLLELIPEGTPAPAATATPAPAPQPVGRTRDEEAAVLQQIEGFFADPDMAVYEDFYGKGQLTPGQKANRLAMLEQAEMILEGSEAMGTKLTAAQAMAQAHLITAAPIAESIVRERIKASVVKRAKGVTLKPSAGKTPPLKGGKYDEQQHVKEIAAELKAVFGTP